MPNPSTRSRVVGLALALCLAGPFGGTSAARPVTAPVTTGGPTAAQAADATPAACAPRAIARVWTRTMLTSITRAGSRAWAVGMTASGPEAPRAPIALAYRAGVWRRMPIARQSGEHALFGIDRSSSGRLWAVGYRQTSSGYRPLLLSWTSGRWVARSLGALGRHGGALVDVRARSDGATFAVGYRVDGVGQHPVVVRRTTKGWRRDRLPIGASGTGVLLAVDARSGSDAWAVGWRSVKGTPQPWVVHWDGSRWRSVSAVRSGSEGVLASVTVGRAGTAWAAGYRIAGGRYRPVVQHWDGHAWRVEPFPAGGMTVGVLRAIGVRADGQPVVAGTRWDAGAARWRAFLAWRGASGWQVDLMGGSGSTDLHAVALGSDDTAWAVGGSGTRSLIATACAADAAANVDAVARVALRAIADEPAIGPSATAPDASPVQAAAPSAVPSSPGSTGPLTTSRAPGPDAPGAASATRPGVLARDVTKAAGLAGTIHSYGAVSADFDGDGWPDLFIGRHSEPGRLLLNDAGRFRAARRVTFPDRDRHGCTAADVDDDGLVDLYCTIGASKGVALKANELWMAQPDGTYQDRATELLASDPIGRGRLAAFFDLDHDQLPDLFLADRPDRPDGLPSRHRVLANRGGDGFVARSVSGLDAGSGADCLRTGDLDGDGWEDVVLCTRGYRPSGYGIRILRNVRGRLVDVTPTSRIARARTMDATLADVNGDRRLDIIEVTRTQLRVHIRRGGRYVLGYTRRLVDGAAVAAGDADGDGDQDVYVAQGTTATQRPDLLLLNRGDGRGYRRLALPGITSGAAESVTAIDRDRNGLTDFLVLNGRTSTHAGPTQLIGLYPR